MNTKNIFILGIFIGSFLNVCIYRIPRKESISFPPSHCPACSHRLGVVDLFPVLSYVFLRGKCRYCGSKISIRYPLVELLNALLILILYLKFGLTIVFLKYAILTSLLIVVSFIDYDHTIIPDELVIFGMITGFILQIVYHFRSNFIHGLFGLFIGGGLFLLIALLTNGAMGGGDIKLMGMLGFYLGWKSIILITLLSFVVGAVVSLFLMALKLKGRKDYIPFGPFIGIASYIVMLYGTEIMNWYFTRIIV